MIEGIWCSLITFMKIFLAVSPINGREGKNYSRGLYVCDLIFNSQDFTFLNRRGPLIFLIISG